jgi:hypothetical protein
MAVLGWTLSASAGDADSWKISADELGTIAKMEFSEALPDGKSRQVELKVTSDLKPSEAKVTVDGKQRAASEREMQFFWSDRGAATAAWKHYLAAERLTLVLLGEPREEDVKLPWDQRALVPSNGKLPEKLIGKRAFVTIFSGRTFIGVIAAGATEKEMVLQIDGSKNVTFTVTALKSVHLLPDG